MKDKVFKIEPMSRERAEKILIKHLTVEAKDENVERIWVQILEAIPIIIDAMLEVSQHQPNVTDNEIEAWAKEQFMSKNDYSHLNDIQQAILICFKAGCSYGAKAMRDRLIKPNNK